MQARVVDFGSDDIQEDLYDYKPPDAESFSVGLTLTAGPVDGEGGDLFFVEVCSAKWLADTYARPGEVYLLRHYLLVESFDFRQVESFVQKYVASCSGETWIEIAEKLARLGQWEFEDYREYEG